MPNTRRAETKMYDRLAKSWWDEDGVLNLLKTMVNPWRVPYFRELINESFSAPLNAINLLDIGCGGGLLTEEFSKMGCRVNGIDLSQKSVAAASDHAISSELQIDYQVGNATALPFADQSFDIISCCDVLEHIPDWQQAIKETARTLKPGGLFFFDTINRTLFSYVAMILGAQKFPLTKIFPPETHSWRMFITPDELRDTLNASGLIPMDFNGGEIKASPIKLLIALTRRNLGRSTIKELGEKFTLRPSANLAANYMGYAVKPQPEE